MHHLEDAVTAAGGIVLRYGVFYGAENDGLIEPVRKRQFPIIGDGGGDDLVDPPRRRGRGDRARARARRGRHLQRSSTTTRPRYASGCRCSRSLWAPSRHGISRAGWRGLSRAKRRRCWEPRRAAPRTRRPSGSWAGSRVTPAGARDSRPYTRRVRRLRGAGLREPRGRRTRPPEGRSTGRNELGEGHRPNAVSRLGDQGQARLSIRPPSIGSAVPVIDRAPGEARKMIASVTSSGSVTRPIRVMSVNSLSSSGSAFA